MTRTQCAAKPSGNDRRSFRPREPRRPRAVPGATSEEVHLDGEADRPVASWESATVFRPKFVIRYGSLAVAGFDRRVLPRPSFPARCAQTCIRSSMAPNHRPAPRAAARRNDRRLGLRLVPARTSSPRQVQSRRSEHGVRRPASSDGNRGPSWSPGEESRKTFRGCSQGSVRRRLHGRRAPCRGKLSRLRGSRHR